MKSNCRNRLATVLVLVSALAAGAEDIVFPPDAGVVDVTQPPYSAKGDGHTDDTSAIQRALEDHPSRNAIIYLRNGTYLVSDTLRWPTGAHGGVSMKRTILQGQSQPGTVIRLRDNAPGFQDPAATKAVIHTGGPPAQRFRNSIRNLTVDIGRGNAGATGVQYMANNQGALQFVTVRSSDPQQMGLIGLDLGYANEQGPCLIRKVNVEGFEVGIRTRYSVDSVTMEYVNLRGQRQFGLFNDGQVLSVHGLESQNAVPAVKNTGSHSVLTLIEAQLDSVGDATNRGPAILNEKDAMLFARKVRTKGHTAAIQSDTPRTTSEPQVSEYTSHPPHSLSGASDLRSLDLPIRDTPDVPWGDVRKDWISPLTFQGKPDGNTDNTIALQRALDAGKKTVYLPNGNWKFDGVVRVPAGVQRIIGCEAKLSGGGTLVVLPGGGPLRVERLDLIYSQVKIEHRSPRTLVISSVTLGGGGYRSGDGSGEVFLEDVCGGPWRFERQNVWARQLNPESQETKIINHGGTVWILGLKTERGGTLVENRGGASTEVLGCFAYANTADEKPPMFINDRSDLSFTVGESVLRKQPFRQLVKETRRDQERMLSMDDVPDRGGGSRVALYVGRASGVRIVRSTGGGTPVRAAVKDVITDVFAPADYTRTAYRGYLGSRMDLNLRHRLLSLNLDTLLRPFEQRSGGQWWLGEHLGKFLHAGTYAWRFSGDEKLKERLDYAATKLIATQLPNGYLGTYPEKDRFVERDGISWDGPVWDVWAHKYCLIGLLTYYQYAGHEGSLQAAKKAADLLCDTFGPGKKSIVRASSHVGMASTSVLEPMAVLYRLTGEKRYLDFCHYILAAWQEPPSPNILHSLLDHGSVYKTANNKAYEMMSNLVGLMELYRLTGDARYLKACQEAWNDIQTRRLYPMGTTSYAEHFTDDHLLPSEARPGDPEPKIGEGCVTVTWLQLTMHLFQVTGLPIYAAELERTIYNALPAAQSPHTGQVCYFLPENGHRRYGEVSHGLKPDISCCSSSIPRGLALIPEVVSGALKGHPAIIQYEAGTHLVHARIKGESVPVELRVETTYPKSASIRITVNPPGALTFPLLLRVPTWTDGFTASVAETRRQGAAGGVLEIEREWTPGDAVDVTISMPLQVRKDPDKSSDRAWVRRGPQVLAVDEQVGAAQRLPSGWWGDQIYSVHGKRNGEQIRLLLVPFAEAGQNKQPYTTMLRSFELDASAPQF